MSKDSKNNFVTDVDSNSVNTQNNDGSNNNNNNNNSNVEETLNINNSDGSGKAKKSRSVSDAERRRRRQQRILGEAGNRLSKINYTHTSLSGDATGSGGGHSTRTTPLTSRRSSPLPSGRSSPIKEEAPNSSFSRPRRNTGNFEGGDSNNNFNPLQSTLTSSPNNIDSLSFSVDNNNSSSTPYIRISEDNTESEFHTISKRLNSVLESEEQLAFNNQENNEFYKNMIGNSLYQEKNSSTTSLESSFGGGSSEYQYSPQYQQFPEQLEHMPLPFLNPDMKIFSPFVGGGSNIDSDININGINGVGSSIQILIRSRLWQLIHFVSMIFLGIFFISSELTRLQGGWTRFYYLNYEKSNEILEMHQIPRMSLFWYFITAELILQSTRLLLQRDQPFQGSTLGTLAANLPEPFPDIIKILLKHKLIWNSLWEDICVLVFIVGFVIAISPILSYFD